MTLLPFERKLCEYVDSVQERLVEIISDLVRIPSENTPPTGNEARCQEYISDFLLRHGWDTQRYSLGDVPDLKSHPLYFEGRDYALRPNLGARKCGTGGGQSLVLSGHIDTVPRGTQLWTRDPFGGQREGNRLYGRGANDMKGGVGTNLFMVEALSQLGLTLRGDLVFETIVDEEFGGSNGTLAGRLQGFNADAAVISEPSFLRVCPAQRGGCTVHITLTAPGGVLTEGELPHGVVDQLTHLLCAVQCFASERRRKAAVHPMYAHHLDPVPVAITKVVTGPWGTKEPITVPETCRIEMYWQMMPGETQDDVKREFFAWIDSVVAAAPRLFVSRPGIEFPMRWLPGSSIAKSDVLVRELAGVATAVLGQEPPIVGIEGPCDMYVFHSFGIPAVLWGARGGNTHGADEYLDIDSAVAAAKTLLVFLCRWCGVSETA